MLQYAAEHLNQCVKAAKETVTIKIKAVQINHGHGICIQKERKKQLTFVNISIFGMERRNTERCIINIFAG